MGWPGDPGGAGGEARVEGAQMGPVGLAGGGRYLPSWGWRGEAPGGAGRVTGLAVARRICRNMQKYARKYAAICKSTRPNWHNLLNMPSTSYYKYCISFILQYA